jgi:hypothetical protein
MGKLQKSSKDEMETCSSIGKICKMKYGHFASLHCAFVPFHPSVYFTVFLAADEPICFFF